MIVVDTNVLLYLYVNGEYSAQARDVFRKDAEWIAPYLWRSEFRNALALYVRKNILTREQVELICTGAEIQMAEMEYHVSTAAVFNLIERCSCSAYDCEFVALAQQFGVSLVTVDKKVLREFPQTAVTPMQLLTT